MGKLFGFSTEVGNDELHLLNNSSKPDLDNLSGSVVLFSGIPLYETMYINRTF